jgi:hypothetical protein
MKAYDKKLRSQQKAIPYLLSCKSYTQAAIEIGVSENQLYEWLRDPEFKSELEKQRNQVTEAAINILKMNTTRAAETLGALLTSANELVQRGAANDILNHVARFRETQELEHRIAVLEEATKRMP